MTAREIQYWLFRNVVSASCIVVPNYTPVGWFECDLFSVTKSMYWTEHEIKLTASDFRADAEKMTIGRWCRVDGQFQRMDRRNKHELLSAGHEKGPSRFYFVLPDKVAAVIEIPPWAGLKVFDGKRYHMPIRKQAPCLHKNKIDLKIIEHARGVCYWRFWKERIALERLRKDRIELERIRKGKCV